MVKRKKVKKLHFVHSVYGIFLVDVFSPWEKTEVKAIQLSKVLIVSPKAS